MRMRILLALGVLFVVSEAWFPFPRPLYECGRRLVRNRVETSTRIVGGRDAALAEFPFQAALIRRKEGRNVFFGGGSLITDKFVLTCGHCLARESMQNVTVWLGLHRMSFPSLFQWRSRPCAFFIHPQFDEATLVNDIALLRLKDHVPLWRLGGYVNTICLPPRGFRPEGFALVSGWGYTSENGPTSDVLQVVELPLVNLTLCKQLIRFLVEDTNICAGFLEGGKDACTGDSGGPLFQIINDVAVQIGVVSWGRSCAVPNSPGVYTDIQPYLPWIERVLRYNSTALPSRRPRTRTTTFAARRRGSWNRRTPAVRRRLPVSGRPSPPRDGVTSVTASNAIIHRTHHTTA
ncbi:trypsin-1-like [Dermacentor variabilis]|uniref:trypsin-1-like n=1 Tax=Dermacentor variabilis TaxID=34621 RepID=UPI003F5C54FC